MESEKTVPKVPFEAYRKVSQEIIDTVLAIAELPLAQEADTTLGDIGGTATELLEDIARNIKDQKFLLTVAGEFSSGKSSLLNVLLGHVSLNQRDRPIGLLPTDIRPTTASITRLGHADIPEPRISVRLRDGSLHQNLPPQELARFAAVIHGKDRTEDPAESVAEVYVYCRSPLLMEGIEIVDTPGLGSVMESHRVVTTRFIPRSDAVLFLLDTNSPITEREKTFLQYVHGYTPNFFFVQTKMDQGNRMETNRQTGKEQPLWEQARQFNLRNIKEVIGPDVRYFPVSAQNAMAALRQEDQKLYEESGIPTLLETLSQYLVRERGLPRQTEYIRRADFVMAQLEQRGTALLSSLQEPTEEPPDERARQEEQRKAASELVYDYLYTYLPTVRDEVENEVLQKTEGEAGRIAQEVVAHIHQLGGPEAFFSGRTPDTEKMAKVERTHIHALQGMVRNRVAPPLKATLNKVKTGLLSAIKTLTDSSNATRHLTLGVDLIPEYTVDLKPNAYLSTETVQKSREKSGFLYGVSKFFTGQAEFETYTERRYLLDETTLKRSTETNLDEIVWNALKDFDTQIKKLQTLGADETTRIRAQADKYLAEREAMRRQSKLEREAAAHAIQGQIKIIQQARKRLGTTLKTLRGEARN